MIRLIQILFGIFLFTFPFSARFLVYEKAAYRFGHFNPWVSEFVYLPEILLIVCFALYLISNRQSAIRSKLNLVMGLLGLFLLNAIIVTIWRGDWALGISFLIRVAEAGMVYALVAGKILETKIMVRVLLLGAVFQISLSLLQWKFSHSIGLGFLGEQTIGPDVLNVAKIDLAGGVKHIRPYGTLLHPNILGAYLLAVLFIALDYLKIRQRLPWLLILGFGIYFTQSLAAFGVGIAVFGLWLLFSVSDQQILRRGLALVLMFVLIITNAWFFFNSDNVNLSEPSYSERLEQNRMSQAMAGVYPLGVGARNYTLEMENFSDIKLKPWEFQPVHNTYFLILNETGVQGLLILLALLLILFDRYWVGGKAIPLIALVLLAPFDHFLWDSFAGLMLVALAVGFFSLNNKKNKET